VKAIPSISQLLLQFLQRASAADIVAAAASDGTAIFE